MARSRSCDLGERGLNGTGLVAASKVGPEICCFDRRKGLAKEFSFYSVKDRD